MDADELKKQDVTVEKDNFILKGEALSVEPMLASCGFSMGLT